MHLYAFPFACYFVWKVSCSSYSEMIHRRKMGN